jgi:diadenosine tetraphosphate (Ap4A) HIT family hydrolase
MKDCPFCNMYDAGERVIAKNSHAWVFPTNMPIVPGHILISPIRHVAKFEDLNAEEVNAIFDLFKVAKFEDLEAKEVDAIFNLLKSRKMHL